MTKNRKRKLLALVLAVLLTGGMMACGPTSGNKPEIADGDLRPDKDFSCTIVVDGGGQWANYNTTDDMTESETNPYPYNTLETLIEEYTALHPNITIKLNRLSYNGDLSTLRSLLSTSDAPDILYNSTTTLAEDYNKNYYAPIDDYLQLANPYSESGEKGAEKWSDIFGDDLKNTVDGHNYYVNMERGAMGIVYNKSFFEEHTLTVPDTYSQFLELIEGIRAADASVVPYTPKGMELDMMYEGAMYIDLMGEIDENKDGWTNSYEMAKAYYNNIFDFTDERYRTLVELLSKRLKYAEDPNKVTVLDSFLSGRTILTEATGNDINLALKYAATRGFEAGVFPLPALDRAAAPGLDRYLDEGVGIRRGSSGLCTAWYITNHAFSASDPVVNRKKINACADFLMFLTAKKNNDRMINEKGVALPLSGETDTKTANFKPLIDVYLRDLQNEKLWGWDTFNSSAAMGLTYYTAMVRARNDFYYGSSTPKAKGDLDVYLAALQNGMDGSLDKLIKLNKWDTSKW